MGGRWNYICTIVDLHNREILASCCGPQKNAELVKRTFSKIKGILKNVKYFYTDRGSKLKNQIIDDVLKAFGIKRSLSNPGSPYDNAVAEATYKSMKTEFINQRSFATIEQLENQLGSYVWWFNNIRLHSSLGYMAPTLWKQLTI